MIKYNTKTINDWNYDASNIVKVYHNGAVCYYKLEGSPTPTAQTPCYAVVDDISQYSSTEFVDVYDKATEKWYKLNNLNQFEEYGLYGNGRNITYYDGKLTIDSGYEYEYSNGAWVNRGELSGTTKIIKSPEYIERTSTYNGYCSLLEYLTQDTKFIIKHKQTTAGGGRIIGDYNSNDNDDWRFFFYSSTLYYDYITQRKQTSKSMPMSAAEEWEVGNYYIKNTATGTNLLTGSTQTFSSRPAPLYIYHSDGVGAGESGTDYGQIWYVKIYKNNVLVRDFIPWTDMNGNYGLYDKVNDVTVQTTGQMTASTTINDVEIGDVEYPLYYTERQDPPTELTFNTMEEALAYQCPYVGVIATINGVLYYFNSNYEWERLNFTITGVTTSSNAFDIKLNMESESVTVYKDNGDGTYNWGIYYPNAITNATNMCSGNTALTSFDWGTANTTGLTGLSSSFYNCSGLTSMPSIPSNVTEIGSSTFYNCRNMNNGGTIEIPEGVQRISNNAFYNVFQFSSKSLKLPSTLNYIYSGAFSNKAYLSNLYITDLSSFCKINFGATSSTVFNGSSTYLYVNNSQVTNVTIPNDITALSSYTFYNAARITGVTIPSTVTRIGGSYTFQYSGLKNVTVPSSVTSWGGSYTFANCTSLTAATLNNSTYVGSHAFEGCTSLTSITFGSNVTAVSSYSFRGCTALKNLTIPSNVTILASYGFSGCTALETVSLEATTPPSIESSTFANVPSTCIFYVPCSAVNAYRTASVWSTYADRILGFESCTTYDWQVVSGEYICYQHDKYEKLKKVRSFDGGTTWEDVTPLQYQRGQLIESGSQDCASRLPSGYAEVEYIQNTGTSYLNIAFTPNQDTRVLCEMQMTANTNYGRLWGAGAWNAAKGIMIDYTSTSFEIKWLGKTSWNTYSSFQRDFVKHTYDYNKNYVYIDETLVGSNTYTTMTSSDPIGIFTYIGSGRPSQSSYWGQEHYKGKMFTFQVYDNGILVRDLVPCVRTSDNEVGAYDIVNDVFYSVPTGYTTDKLIAGPTV